MLLLFQLAQWWGKVVHNKYERFVIFSAPPFVCVFIKRLIRETERKRGRDRERRRDESQGQSHRTGWEFGFTFAVNPLR